jgi:glutaredoxin 3
MAPVILYSTILCPYCSAAKNLLKQKGVSFEAIDVTMNPIKRAAMSEKSGGKTSVPQIFIDDLHVGGFDELAALDRQGKLDALLGL